VRHYTDGYYARPKCLRYPGGVAYHYNTAGYLVQEKDAVNAAADCPHFAGIRCPLIAV